MNDFEGFRSQFPALKEKTYLNTAAWGLLHPEVHQWRQAHDNGFLQRGSAYKMEAAEILDKTRRRIAESFNASEHQVALAPNFSLGLNLLLEGLPPGSRILIPEDEYPSLSWPFESRDFRLTRVSLGPGLETRILDALGRERIDVLAVSLVQWVSGQLLEPDFLKALRVDFPDLLIIADATQYVGAFRFDFHGSGIDVLGVSGYKWLLGGNGNGFLVLRDGLESMLSVKSVGFNSTGHQPGDWQDAPLARRLEPGHLDVASFGSLYASLGVLQELGLDRIDRYSRTQSARVGEALAELGYWSGSGRHSTIFNIPERDGLYQRLTDHGIVCARRGDGIRLSFHCYNSEGDLERLQKLL